jgi:DNA-binding CsgD family transcriptional regulator
VSNSASGLLGRHIRWNLSARTDVLVYVSAQAPPSAPLAGRDHELTELDRALDAVDGGASRLIGILGEPGIGKSRLLGELAAWASARGHLVLTGRAAELERDVPFALWAETIDASGSDGMPEDEVADLAAALPAAGRVVPQSAERHRIARAIRLLLTRLAARRPVTLLLDDVNWADPASADVLTLLAHRPPERTLVAVAARTLPTTTLEAVFGTAVRHGFANVLRLAPLAPAVAEALLPAGLGPAARARVLLESGGNPFYLQELAHATATSATLAAPLGVPRAVMAALTGEIAALPPRTRQLAQGAAVAGDPFEPLLAAAAAGLPESVGLAALDALVAAGIVRAGDQPRRFRFRHPLVRHAVYEATPSGWRLAAHARAADALAARGATVASRAHHVERAARPGDLAAVELLAAAAADTATPAPGTAAAWYEAALRLLPETVEHEERRAALLTGLGAALVSAGRAVEARQVLRGLLGRLPAGATGERIAMAERLAEIEALSFHDLEAARELLDAESAVLGQVEPRLNAKLTVARATMAFADADHFATFALAEQAGTEARAAGDRPLEALAAILAAGAAYGRLRRDDPDALAAVDVGIAEAGARVDALSDAEAGERLHALAILAIVRLNAGDFTGATAAVERGLMLARRTGQGLLAPAFVELRGLVECELGHLDTAEADALETLECALLSGIRLECRASISLSRVALARGRVDLALDHAQSACDRFGCTEPYAQAGPVLADARLAAGDARGAVAAMEAFGWLDPRARPLDRVRSVETAIRVLLADGRVDDAAAWARRAAAEGGGRRGGVFGAILAHAEAAVLLARGDERQAAAVALAGAAEAVRGRAPLWASRCRTLAGQALGAGGRDELRRAAAEFEQLGAWGYRGAALRALRRLGDRPRTSAGGSARDGRLAALTPREREVAALVAGGQTNAQIAARLHLSESTVEKHVSRTLGKLRMSTRAGLIGLRFAHP